MSPPATWDVGKARILWDKNLSCGAIAKQCHVTKNAVVGYSKRHWPAREIDAVRSTRHFTNLQKVPIARPSVDPVPIRAEWNVDLGRSLWDAGKSRSEIARACGTTPNAIHGYAKRHWPKSPVAVERSTKMLAKGPPLPKAHPLPPGATTLPPLMSLTFGDD